MGLRTNTWQHRKRPFVLRLKVMSHSPSGVSSAALLKLMPALFTAMSSPPSSATTVSTILRMATPCSAQHAHKCFIACV